MFFFGGMGYLLISKEKFEKRLKECDMCWIRTSFDRMLTIGKLKISLEPLILKTLSNAFIEQKH